MTTRIARVPEVPSAPGVCPQCGLTNSLQTQFCTHCHQLLIYRCPQCWHEQRHGHTCHACHLNLDHYWQVVGATKQVALIQEEATNLQRSAERAESALSMLGSIPLQALPFFQFLGLTFLINWLRRRFQ